MTMPKKTSKKSHSNGKTKDTKGPMVQAKEENNIKWDEYINSSKIVSTAFFELLCDGFVSLVTYIYTMILSYVNKDQVKKYKRPKKTVSTEPEDAAAPPKKSSRERFNEALDSTSGQSFFELFSFAYLIIGVLAVLTFGVTWLFLSVFVGTGWGFQLTVTLLAGIGYFLHNTK